MAEELKDTLNLPVTDFPMRAGLAEREPVRIAHWERNGLYGQIQARAAGKFKMDKALDYSGEGNDFVGYDELTAHAKVLADFDLNRNVARLGHIFATFAASHH